MTISLKNGSVISKVVISTILGHSGGGMFPYTLPFWRGHKEYQKLLEAVVCTGTTVFSKSSTPEERRGKVFLFDPRRPWTIIPFLYTARKYIKQISCNGMVNSFGLSNRGFKHHLREINQINTWGIRAIPNVFLFMGGKTIEQLLNEALPIAGDIVTSFLYYRAEEANWSCPNSGEDVNAHHGKMFEIRRKVKCVFHDLTLIDKMSPLHPIELLQEMERDGRTIFHLFNTIPWDEVHPPRSSPIKGVPEGGGYSGPASKERVFKLLKEAGKKLRSPIIMGHGVENEDDVKRLFGFGAKSVSICKMARQNTQGTIRILEQYNR